MASKIKVDQIDTTLGSGNVTIDPDNNTLVVDTDNSRVGIGTSSPNRVLDARSSQQIVGTFHSTGSSSTISFVNSSSTDDDDDQLGTTSGNNMWFRTNGAERMRITADGSVGIGTTNPDTNSQLHVRNDNANAKITLQTSETYDCYINFSGATSEASIGYEPTSNTMVFANAADGITSNVRMIIDNAGDLLVGCTSLPSSSVAGLGIDASNASELRCSAGGTGNSTQIRFLNPNGEVGAIRTSGTATSYITSSDYRLKENVTADWEATTRIRQLNPVRFNFITDADTTVDGFLAHEVQDIVPEAISGTKDAMRDEEYEVEPAVLDENDNVITPAVMGTRSVIDPQGIDQSKLVPLLVKSLQEALNKIDTLETRLEALENA